VLQQTYHRKEEFFSWVNKAVVEGGNQRTHFSNASG
jgi:hypothetical protein